MTFLSPVTNDFLDYIHHLEKMEIEVWASDFNPLAAYANEDKSPAMLLPRPELMKR